MNKFYENNKLAVVIAVCLLVSAIIIAIGTAVYDNYQEKVSDVRKCVLIDDEKQLEYELKTNDGFKVALYGTVSSSENVHFDFMNPTNDFLKLSYTKYRYTKHVRTTTDSNGKTKTVTTYSWDNIGSNSIKANSATILGQNIIVSDIKYLSNSRLSLSADMFTKGKVSGDKWYPRKKGNFVGNIRYKFEYVPNNTVCTIATNIRSDGMFSDVSRNTEKMLIVGTKDDMIKSLKTSSSFVIVVIVLVLILSNGLIVYKFYEEEFKYRF